jgi:DNA invertase Pin-like site-specific DNA recombinase
MVKRAALYARVSTDDKGQDPTMQMDALRRFATERGWSVGEQHVYIDEGYSGAKVSRPALDAMMAAVRAGEIDVVIVWRFDRLARSTRHLLDVLAEFNGLHVDFISQQESVDTSTPIGRMVFTFIAAIAEFEREILRERVKAGMAHAKAKGRRFGRKLRVIDLRPASAMLAMGHSLEETSKALGIPRRTLQRHLERKGLPTGAAPEGS